MAESPQVGVIGLGTMGAGIAEVFARGGCSVIAVDYDESAVERGRAHLRESTDRALLKGKLTSEDQTALLHRLTYHTDVDAVRECSVVVEAISEDLDLKRSIFAGVDRVVSPDAILATNTSSLSVTALASASVRPARVVGVHFFNPAPIQPLVELIRTVLTDEKVLAQTRQLLTGLGKSVVSCGDRAGFIVNFLLIGYLNRAVRLYQDGFATREEIDQAMIGGAGYPMGPLALLDLIGLDVTQAVLLRMYDETKDRLVAPTPLLTQLVLARRLGRKSGVGLYRYESDGSVADDPGSVPMPTVSRASALPMVLVAPYLNDALTMVQSNYATPDDIDTSMSQGCRMPKPFDVLAALGPGEILTAQAAIFDETAEPGHRPALLLEQLATSANPLAALDHLRTR